MGTLFKALGGGNGSREKEEGGELVNRGELTGSFFWGGMEGDAASALRRFALPRHIRDGQSDIGAKCGGAAPLIYVMMMNVWGVWGPVPGGGGGLDRSIVVWGVYFSSIWGNGDWAGEGQTGENKMIKKVRMRGFMMC